VTKTYKCRVCGSENIVKNGTNKVGQAQYHCEDCGAYRVLEPKPNDKGQRRDYVLRSYAERASLRGLSRIYGVARQTALKWVLKPTCRACQAFWTVCCPSSVVMGWKSMSCGPSSSARITPSGCGPPCVAARARLSPLYLVTVVLTVVVGCGRPFRVLTVAVGLTAISGKLMKLSSHSVPIILLARKLV
jgi:transposase-like protein